VGLTLKRVTVDRADPSYEALGEHVLENGSMPTSRPSWPGWCRE